MSYPLIILGAGASHDFVHPTTLGADAHRHKLIFPLIDHLVDGKFTDSELQARYSPVKTLFARLVSCTQKKSFEKCIEGWGNYEQLNALRLYLGDYFWKKSLSEDVKKYPNNFSALIDYIKGSQAKGAYIVTFNYDVLLENELGLNRFFNLSNYIDGSVDNIRIVKIHGSCDWYHLISRVAGNAYTALARYPKFFDRPKEILTRRFLEQHDSGAERFFHIPVVSLPTTFTKSYACPDNHIQDLIFTLPDIQKILIIGWKAGDPFLLEKFNQIKSPIDLTVVSGGERGAEKVAKEVEKYVRINKKTLFAGFSNFIGSSECDSFFEK